MRSFSELAAGEPHQRLSVRGDQPPKGIGVTVGGPLQQSRYLLSGGHFKPPPARSAHTTPPDTGGDTYFIGDVMEPRFG